VNIEDIGKAAMQAWGRIKKSHSRMWGEWMTIGEGLIEGRRWAMQQAGTDKPEGKGYTLAFGDYLKRYKLEDMDKSDRAKLLQLMEERPAIEEWRATLPTNQRRDLNNPTIVWRKWQADTKVEKPKKHGQGDARARAMVEEQQARIEELEEERLSPDASPTEVADRIVTLYPDTAREIAELILKALPKPTADEHARRMEAAGFRRTKRRHQPQPEA
jgi:hypothetical protein